MEHIEQKKKRKCTVGPSRWGEQKGWDCMIKNEIKKDWGRWGESEIWLGELRLESWRTLCRGFFRLCCWFVGDERAFQSCHGIGRWCGVPYGVHWILVRVDGGRWRHRVLKGRCCRQLAFPQVVELRVANESVRQVPSYACCAKEKLWENKLWLFRCRKLLWAVIRPRA